MSKIDFDDYSEKYNEVLAKSVGRLAVSGCDFFDSFKINCIGDLFSSERQYSILDFGCGIGNLTVLLARRFRDSQIYGYDVSSKAVVVAQQKGENIKNLFFMNSLKGGKNYDIILAANVFHHIESSKRISTLQEIKDVLNPGGTVIIFEHNPLNPLTRYVVNRCPFDADAELISLRRFIRQGLACRLNVRYSRYVLIFPWKHHMLRKIEKLFGSVPFGTQYMLLLNNYS